MNNLLEIKIKERTDNHTNVLFADYNSGTQQFRSCQLILSGHYVDDYLAVLELHEDLQYFLTYLINWLHNEITFTVEMKSYSTLPFLGILITRHGDKIPTTVYQKLPIQVYIVTTQVSFLLGWNDSLFPP